MPVTGVAGTKPSMAISSPLVGSELAAASNTRREPSSRGPGSNSAPPKRVLIAGSVGSAVGIEIRPSASTA